MSKMGRPVEGPSCDWAVRRVLADAVEASGLRRNVVARKAGFSPARLSQILGGRDPCHWGLSWSTIERVATALGYSARLVLEQPEEKDGSGI